MTGFVAAAEQLFESTTTVIWRRLTSLDVFRGFTIMAMIIVSNQGDYTHVHPLLLHSEWDGITPTDLILPFFLFIVGVALVASLRPYLATTPAEEGRRRPDRALYMKLGRRMLVLVLLGLLVNGLPSFELETWRITGILQRIGLCYFIAALIMVHVPLRWQWGIGAAILSLYAAILSLVSAPGVTPGQLEPTANLSRWLDLAVFSKSHLFYPWPTEPEGLLSTPAAVVSVLLGGWAGLGVVNRSPSQRRGLLVVVSGLLLAALGLACSPSLPMVKMIWTPTFVLFSGGCAMACFGLSYLFTDVLRAPRSMWVVEVFGRNAIVAYLLSELTPKALHYVSVRGTAVPNLVAAAIGRLDGGPIPSELGSLLYACLVALGMWAALYVPYRRGSFIRV